ncbi:MAG: tRNA (guanosine(46)-N7)-methyltransferase TrmB [Clostridia bacterium]|nr:tRNA (guanosine(46)-N7)-methyltransferase TrmB [Clostridia bacterium]
MMHRKVKHKDEIIQRCKKWIVLDPCARKGSWAHSFTSHGKPYLEIGSGKGQFITRLASINPSKNFIAAEGGDKIFVRLLQKAEEEDIQNLLLIPEYMSDLQTIFSRGEVAGIYLNFCDPWPKERHAKRRLTHRDMLAQYRTISQEGALLAFKTDNSELFEFSMSEFLHAGLHILAYTKDLHKSEYAADNITTEYEDKFTAKGCPIFYALAAL